MIPGGGHTAGRLPSKHLENLETRKMTTQDTAAETSATPTPIPAAPEPREIFIAKKAAYVAMLAKDLTFSGTDEE